MDAFYITFYSVNKYQIKKHTEWVVKNNRILINNIDLIKISKEQYYSLLSTTFQNFKMFPIKISENALCKCEKI